MQVLYLEHVFKYFECFEIFDALQQASLSARTLELCNAEEEVALKVGVDDRVTDELRAPATLSHEACRPTPLLASARQAGVNALLCLDHALASVHARALDRVLVCTAYLMALVASKCLMGPVNILAKLSEQ